MATTFTLLVFWIPILIGMRDMATHSRPIFIWNAPPTIGKPIGSGARVLTTPYMPIPGQEMIKRHEWKKGV